MIKPKKLPRDPNARAHAIMQLATGQTTPEESETLPESQFVEHGSKGGKSRASKLSPEKRKEIAKKAAESRWKKE